MPCCSANGCKNLTSFKPEGVSFHKFPKGPHLSKKWLKALGKVDGWQVTNSVVCSEHFRDSDFIRVNPTTTVLKPDAVPSVNLQINSSSYRFTTPDNENNVNLIGEHSQASILTGSKQLKHSNKRKRSSEENEIYEISDSSDNDSPVIILDSDSGSQQQQFSNKSKSLPLSVPDGDGELQASNREINSRSYFGTFTSDDMKQTISDLETKNTKLQSQNNNLKQKIQCLKSLLEYLQENNFLRQYSAK